MLPRMSDSPTSAEDDDLLAFTPVPVRARHDGWTPKRQRDFIGMLAQIGSVGAAARAVGKTGRSAYKLRDRWDAASFGRAWEQAIDRGTDNVRDHVIDRALHGREVAITYRGELVATERRYDDRVAIAVLSGRGRSLERYCEQAEERGAYQSFLDIERAWRRDKAEVRLLKWQLRKAENEVARLSSNLASIMRVRRNPPEQVAPARGGPSIRLL